MFLLATFVMSNYRSPILCFFRSRQTEHFRPHLKQLIRFLPTFYIIDSNMMNITDDCKRKYKKLITLNDPWLQCVL